MKKITHKNIRHFLLKFLKDYNDLEITTDALNMLVIKYGWSDYEEGEDTTITVNYKEFTVRKVEIGYSVYGGEYEFDDTMKFINEHDLYANFKKEINRYFE